MNAPETINGLDVIASEPKRACAGELPYQHWVICKDRRDTYTFWTIGWDAHYLGGSWVAFWGHYDLTLNRAQEILNGKLTAQNLGV